MKADTKSISGSVGSKTVKLILAIASLLLITSALLYAGENAGPEPDLDAIKKEIETLLPSREKDELWSRYYLLLAREKLDKGKYEEVLKILDSKSEYIREEKTASLMRGIAYYFTESFYEAEATLLNVAYEDGGNKDALYLLGSIYYERGDLTIAIENWEKALRLDQDNSGLKRLIAKAKREAAVESGMDQDFTGRFLIHYDGKRDEKTGNAIAGILEDAYYDIGTDLNHFPKKEITVIIYTEKEFKEVTLAPGWAGGIYDGKIRIPSGGVEISSLRLKQLIYHEYTHALIHSLTGGLCPRWLHEGLAMYEESRLSSEGEQFRIVKNRSPAIGTSNDIDRLFSSEKTETALLAYRNSFTIVKKLIDNYGIHKIAGLLHGLEKERPFEETFNKVYGDYNLSFDKWWGNVYKN